MENHREAYKAEAYELLSELESSLLELEENPTNMELISRVFRAMHTIKGSGAMFGFDDIAQFTHEVETVFDLVREAKISVTKRLVDQTLSACDQIRKMVDGVSTDEDEVKSIVADFKEMIPDRPESDALPADNTANTPAEACGGMATYRIRFVPQADILACGTNPILLLDELRELGECNVFARTHKIPDLEEMDPEKCYLNWDIVLTTAADINAIKDVFIFVEDDCEITIDVIDDGSDANGESACKKLGEILVDRGDVSSDELMQVLKSQKRIGEMLIETKVVDKEAVESALSEQEHVKNSQITKKNTAVSSSIRVAAEKLDSLVDLVGELVIAQARLSQKANLFNDSELHSIAEEVERLTGELRDNTMDIRMLPIGTTFSKFKRLVRDLSNELGKEVVMETEGGETELDKTVIERLNDPLVHIIRNSIDHGIEGPDVREDAGKPRQGRVHLSAFHSGANVLIQITDDGAGLDRDAIRRRAVERGLIPPDAELPDKEIFGLIFSPGFSTAKTVTEISGRGVGMDVVKRGIDALRGSIEVESEKGIGSTITLKLPLTLAIIEGLMVEIGDGNFVVPLAAVEECVELGSDDAAKVRKRNMMDFRGKIIPYMSLRELFQLGEALPDREQIVITEVNGGRVGFGVDTVIGQHQTVIKALSKVYKEVEGLSGATILGDGTVALILDVHKLLQSAEKMDLGKGYESANLN